MVHSFQINHAYNPPKKYRGSFQMEETLPIK